MKTIDSALTNNQEDIDDDDDYEYIEVKYYIYNIYIYQ